MYMKLTSRMFIYFTCNLIYEHTLYCCLSSGTHILVQSARLWLNILHLPSMIKVVVHTQYHYMSEFKIATFCIVQWFGIIVKIDSSYQIEERPIKFDQFYVASCKIFPTYWKSCASTLWLMCQGQGTHKGLENLFAY